MKISIALLQTESDRPSLLPTTVRRRLYVGLVILLSNQCNVFVKIKSGTRN